MAPISVRVPAEFRAHVLGEEFFDAENDPEVTFRSTSVELGDYGAARVWSSAPGTGVLGAVWAQAALRRCSNPSAPGAGLSDVCGTV